MPHVDTQICIIGAGFGGIGIAIRLKEAGFDDFLILEKAGEVGGTWRDNVYPGCACDIPSTLYSFSFERNAAWTRVFPRQRELWDYLIDCTHKYGLRPHLRFDRELTEARYDDETATWSVRTGDGSELTCRVLIGAMGPLNKPKLPEIPGRDRFAGTAFHSARWDPSVDLRGKRVAVIGTGASAIQIVPEIAPLVSQLTVFQRTPPWIIPRFDRPISGRERALRRWIPGYGWAIRTLLYWILEVRAYGFTVKPELLHQRESLALRYLHREVKDPELRRVLTPDYRMGCKRVLISDDYYAAIQSPNVRLVTTPIEAIEEHGIRTADDTAYDADVIVYATGFHATAGVAPARIFGHGGLELADAWRNGMEAYLGTSVAGFPNLFTIIGPNTGLGHNSMVVMMEAQYAYVVDALRLMRRRALRALDVRSEVQRRFNERLQRRMAGTVWATGCSAWYQDERGKNTTLWPGFTFVYRHLTRRFRPDRYVQEAGR
jgi:cation diffusion facilitator CzcD-associated flavoprotein CzcO